MTGWSCALVDVRLVFPGGGYTSGLGGIGRRGVSIMGPARPYDPEFSGVVLSLVNEPFHFCCFVNSAKPFSNIGGVNTSPVYRYALGGLINVV